MAIKDCWRGCSGRNRVVYFCWNYPCHRAVLTADSLVAIGLAIYIDRADIMNANQPDDRVAYIRRWLVSLDIRYELTELRAERSETLVRNRVE